MDFTEKGAYRHFRGDQKKRYLMYLQQLISFSLFFLRRISTMDCSYSLPCPNCGAIAIRRYFQPSLVETSCDRCDYLLVVTEKTGQVMDSSAVSLSKT